MMAAASLELSGISKRYPGVQALNRVDFECRPGEIHAVLGENGSGKSTLLGIAGGAVAADEGRVADHGQTARRRRSAAGAPTRLGRRLSRRIRWCARLTVAENLLLGAVDGPKSLAGKRQWAAKQLSPYDLGISPDALVGQFERVAAAVPRNRQGAGGGSEGLAARRADFEPRHFRRRKVERDHPPDCRGRRRGRLRQSSIAGNPGARRPGDDPARRRRPGHL